MKPYEIFILIHDQDLILRLEKSKVYRNLKEYKYLFLGYRDTDKLKDLKDKVVIARDLPNNIEEHKSVYDYTGHYALARNNIIGAENVVILHYDCFFFSNFVKKVSEALKKSSNSFINFNPLPLDCNYFLEDTYAGALIKSMKEVYNVDINQKLKELIESGDKYWQSGGSFACSADVLKKYIDYTLPLIPIIEKDDKAAHNTERMIKFFCTENHIEEIFIPNVLEHIFNSSHNQTYHSEEAKIEVEKRFEKLLNGDLNKEYSFYTLKKILKFFFSIQNQRRHKCITIFGIKIKINKKNK